MKLPVRRILSVVGRELLDTLRGFAQFYSTYARMAWKPRGSVPERIFAVAVFAVPLLFLVLHPLLPAWLKIAGALLIAGAAVFVTRDAIARAKAADTETRPIVRGAILGLFPFFLVSIVALLWGLVQILPVREGTNAWLVFTNSAFPEGGRGFSASITAAGLGTLDWWCYGLRITLGISLESALESISAIFSSDPLVVARIMPWHPLFEILATLVNLISAALFVGIVADIALAVQNKVALGDEVGEAASENYGLTLVSAATKLGPDAPARIVQAQLGLATLRKHARQSLKQHLRAPAESSEPAHRARAARALGELGEPASALPLCEALSEDPSPEVRAAAAQALGAVAAESSVTHLVRALATDTEASVRSAAAAALTTWRPAAAATPLYDALAAGITDEVTRRETARVLATFIDEGLGMQRDTAVPELATLARTATQESAAAGAFATLAWLARSRDQAHTAAVPPKAFADAARAALQRLADASPESPASVAALEMLGALGDWLRSDEASELGERVREALSTKLVRLHDDAPLLNEASPHVQTLAAQILRALGYLGSAEAVSQLSPYLESEAQEVQKAAFDGLAATLEPAAKAQLLEVLQAEQPSATLGRKQQLACRALARLGDPSVCATLQRYREHPAALEALGRLGQAEDLTPLSEMLEPARPLELRLAVVSALGHILERLRTSQQREAAQTEGEVVARLKELLLDATEMPVVEAAAEALARAEGVAALETLQPVLKEDSERAAFVARGLAAIEDPAFVARLAELLPGTSEQAGAVILDALGKLEPSALSEEMLNAVQTSLSRLGEGASHLWSQTTGHLTRGLGWILGEDNESEPPQ